MLATYDISSEQTNSDIMYYRYHLTVPCLPPCCIVEKNSSVEVFKVKYEHDPNEYAARGNLLRDVARLGVSYVYLT